MPGNLLAALVQVFISADFIKASIRFSTPLIGAATGEIISELAGILNIGLEGMMLIGAFAGVLGSWLTHNVWGGLATALLAGGSIGLLHGVVSILLGANQVVSGAAINLGALGLTTYLNRAIFGSKPPPVPAFEPLSVPILSRLPFIGPALFEHIPLVYFIYGLAILAGVIVFRTQWGLRLRAIGENPEAAASAGIPVIRWQMLAVIVCGMFAGVAGTFFSLGNIRYFTDNMTAGNGFIALAVVIMARWRPQRAIVAALVFGAANALAFRFQAFNIPVPYELLLMLPYVLTLLVYVGVVGRTRPPNALGKPNQA